MANQSPRTRARKPAKIAPNRPTGCIEESREDEEKVGEDELLALRIILLSDEELFDELSKSGKARRHVKYGISALDLITAQKTSDHECPLFELALSKLDRVWASFLAGRLS